MKYVITVTYPRIDPLEERLCYSISRVAITRQILPTTLRARPPVRRQGGKLLKRPKCTGITIGTDEKSKNGCHLPLWIRPVKQVDAVAGTNHARFDDPVVPSGEDDADTFPHPEANSGLGC